MFSIDPGRTALAATRRALHEHVVLTGLVGAYFLAAVVVSWLYELPYSFGFLENLDFADVRTVMERGGVAMIGMGESDAEDKAADSVKKALRSPLLDVDISGATAALVNVVGGPDMTIAEAEGVVQEIYERVDPSARIIWGAMVDPSMQHRMRTMLVVTGVSSPQIYGRTEGLTKKVVKHFEIDFMK